MSKINVNLDLDLQNKKALLAFSKFLETLATYEPGEAIEQENSEETSKAENSSEDKAPEEAPKRKYTRKPKIETIEPEPQESPTPEEENSETEELSEVETVEETEEVEDDGAPEVTFSDLKSLMATLIDTHRKEIKQKMEEFGAKNMSSLKEENYGEFYQFLENLQSN